MSGDRAVIVDIGFCKNRTQAIDWQRLDFTPLDAEQERDLDCEWNRYAAISRASAMIMCTRSYHFPARQKRNGELTTRYCTEMHKQMMDGRHQYREVFVRLLLNNAVSFCDRHYKKPKQDNYGYSKWIAWRHQAITLINVDLSSVTPNDIHLRTLTGDTSTMLLSQLHKIRVRLVIRILEKTPGVFNQS